MHQIQSLQDVVDFGHGSATGSSEGDSASMGDHWCGEKRTSLRLLPLPPGEEHVRTREEVSAEKIRGGFYSPPDLVRVCWDRVHMLVGDRRDLRILEPSAGDGTFIRGLSHHRLAAQVRFVTAIEVLESEAKKCSAAAFDPTLQADVIEDSVISWSCTTDAMFDVAVGNPPFVRFQFVKAADKQAIAKLAIRYRLSFGGVSNLWIPVLLAALSRLRASGVFAFIIPAECFTGISAGVVREWMAEWVDELRFDLFPPGSFPAVLQEVVVLSGRKRGTKCNGIRGSLMICEHDARGQSRSWVHPIIEPRSTWTRYLLTPRHLESLVEASELPGVHALSHIAKFEVAAVTGANGFFSVDESTVDRYGLHAWAVPLLPRARHAAGLRYVEEDHIATVASGAKAMLLHFAADLPDPMNVHGASRYLKLGVLEGLPERYKCRIRDPWYRVPGVKPGRLMLSKRCHHYPRVILNEANVVTTDTIYRGWMTGDHSGREADLVAACHNSLTLLSAEIEGRSFGGGVLELVPSEVGRLLVPLPMGFDANLARLDMALRSKTQQEFSFDPKCGGSLIEETNCLLTKEVGIPSSLMDLLEDGRQTLLRRRLDRSVTV